jgi:hypothetical protein
MQDRLLFEYSVLRLMPRVEREEFLNVGVILYCSARTFLQCRYEVNRQRIDSICEKVDYADLLDRLEAFTRICNGSDGSGPIGELPLPSRFRWLTANRSTILQSSGIHPGLCLDPEETLNKLFAELVK